MRTLSLNFCQNTIDGIMIIAIRTELKSYLQVSDKENQTSVSNSTASLNKLTFEIEESFLLDQSRLSTLNYKLISDLFEKLKNPNRLIIAKLNTSSLCNKFDLLIQMLHNNLDILLISETKIDSLFLTAQFQI